MFSYSGWNAAVYVAEEIKGEPVRNVRALLSSARSPPWPCISRSTRCICASCRRRSLSAASPSAKSPAERLFGSAAGVLFAVVAVVIALSSSSAMTTARTARAARDGARRRVRPGGRTRPSALPDAGRGDHRAGRVELAARAVGDVRSAADMPRASASFCFLRWPCCRCSSCAARRRKRRCSARGAIRGRRRSFRWWVSRSSSTRSSGTACRRSPAWP